MAKPPKDQEVLQRSLEPTPALSVKFSAGLDTAPVSKRRDSSNCRLRQFAVRRLAPRGDLIGFRRGPDYEPSSWSSSLIPKACTRSTSGMRSTNGSGGASRSRRYTTVCRPIQASSALSVGATNWAEKREPEHVCRGEMANRRDSCCTAGPTLGSWCSRPAPEAQRIGRLSPQSLR
jgi:hypothetical protein